MNGEALGDGIVASDLIRQNTFLYSKHILSNTFPCVIDGLKKVKRRIIYRQPPDETFGGMKLVSNTIAIHPYGDASIYDAACRMTDTFRNTFPLLHLIGKGGSYSGDTAASARYTEFKLTDFCRDVFISGTNFKTIPMEPTEDLTGMEIQYFIPKLPTALLISNESIGFGYSSRNVPMKFENVCDLVIDFLSCPNKVVWDYTKLAKLFSPCLPIKVHVCNEHELITAYSQGVFDAPVETEGLYVISSNNSVLFRTVSFGVSPSAIRSNLTAAIRDKNHWLMQMDASFDAFSEDKNYIDFRITIKRGGNIFDLIENIKGILRLRSSTHINSNFTFNDKLVPIDPPGVIKMWYKERYRSIFSAKKHRQQELQLVRMRLEAYLIICEHVDEVIGIIKTLSVNDIYKTLKKSFGLSTRQCEMILNANLQILMKTKRDELEDRLAKTVAELDAIVDSFKSIDSEMIGDIKALKKKYKTDSTFVSSESKYIGCLIIGELGIMQIDNTSAIVDTGKLFSGVNLRFLPYHSSVKMIKFGKQSNSFNRLPELPLTSNASGISVQYKTKSHLFIRGNGKSQCLPDTTMITANKSVVNHISDKPLVVTSAGRITKAPEDLFVGRKHASNVLYAFDLINGVDKYIVISVNAAHPNVVRLQEVDLKTRVLLSAAGETAVVAVVADGTNDVVVNLPEFHKYSIMHITDIQKNVRKGKLYDMNTRLLAKA